MALHFNNYITIINWLSREWSRTKDSNLNRSINNLNFLDKERQEKCIKYKKGVEIQSIQQGSLLRLKNQRNHSSLQPSTFLSIKLICSQQKNKYDSYYLNLAKNTITAQTHVYCQSLWRFYRRWWAYHYYGLLLRYFLTYSGKDLDFLIQ